MKKTWTVGELIGRTADYLCKKGIDTPRLDAEILLAHLLGVDRVRLYMDYRMPLNGDELVSFREMVKRRAAREPLQYITGEQEFWSMRFKVTPAVLIPRPETELLVEEGAREMNRSFPGSKGLKILDIGTGCGALAVSLAREIEGSLATGVDLSREAVAVAKENAELNGLSSSVRIVEGDIFAPVADETFHLVVSNPPYIPRGEIRGLQREIRDYEPLSALDGGEDGLDYYRRIVSEAPGYLKPGGWLMVEHGEGQDDDVSRMFRDTGRFAQICKKRDLAGIYRIVKGRMDGRSREV